MLVTCQKKNDNLAVQYEVNIEIRVVYGFPKIKPKKADDQAFRRAESPLGNFHMVSTLVISGKMVLIF